MGIDGWHQGHLHPFFRSMFDQQRVMDDYGLWLIVVGNCDHGWRWQITLDWGQWCWTMPCWQLGILRVAGLWIQPCWIATTNHDWYGHPTVKEWQGFSYSGPWPPYGLSFSLNPCFIVYLCASRTSDFICRSDGTVHQRKIELTPWDREGDQPLWLKLRATAYVAVSHLARLWFFFEARQLFANKIWLVDV